MRWDPASGEGAILLLRNALEDVARMSTPAQFRTEVRSTEGSSVRGGFTGQCETSVALRHVEFKSSAHVVTEAECGILRKEDICWSGKCLRGCCTGRGFVWAQDSYRLCLRSSSSLLS